MADGLYFRDRQQRRFRRIDLQTNGLDDDDLRRMYRFSAQSLDRQIFWTIFYDDRRDEKGLCQHDSSYL
ncbi:hypothetical protein DPMN_116918 [Dreissena polymorpha]|uniref:Uncharacterized protein n=1 Tax=Dreissena polymorpha TaxID=45954 RepID=A0A9D4KQB5_DREPO|nr:hypothetical protein DPMN_116918 [Dreissena polymorpha]